MLDLIVQIKRRKNKKNNETEKNNETPDILVIYMGTNDLTRGIASISFKNAYITICINSHY